MRRIKLGYMTNGFGRTPYFMANLRDVGFNVVRLPTDYNNAKEVLEGEKFDRILLEPRSLSINDTHFDDIHEADHLRAYSAAGKLVEEVVHGDGAVNRNTFTLIKIDPTIYHDEIVQRFNGSADSIVLSRNGNGSNTNMIIEALRNETLVDLS